MRETPPRTALKDGERRSRNSVALSKATLYASDRHGCDLADRVRREKLERARSEAAERLRRPLGQVDAP